MPLVCQISKERGETILSCTGAFLRSEEWLRTAEEKQYLEITGIVFGKG